MQDPAQKYKLTHFLILSVNRKHSGSTFHEVSKLDFKRKLLRVIYVITDKEVSFLKRLLELINYFVCKTDKPRGE